MFTVIIPCKNGHCSSIKASDYHLVDEVIAVIGDNPSKQRNEAIRGSGAEWFLFLDDDCILNDQSLNMYKERIESKRVKILGGPAVIRGERFFESYFSLFFRSMFSFYKSSSRYEGHGIERYTDESELILCNLVINRSVFEDVGFFNEELYPNEENELLLRADRYKKLYIPEAKVSRTISNDPLRVFSKIFRYGKGRGRHILSGFNFDSIKYFIPSVFVLFLLVSLVYWTKFSASVIIIYMMLNFLASLQIFEKSLNVFYFLVSLIFFPAAHLFYGLGLMIGVCTR